MTEIRSVREEDRAFWFRLDRHLSGPGFAEKVRTGQGLVLLEDGVPAGLLRWNLFWDEHPFCCLLYVEAARRGRGLGRMLMTRWEEDMRARGHALVLTSTQADEEAQHFYRKLGYRDCGGLVLDAPGYAQPMELILMKRLKADAGEGFRSV